MILYYHWLHNYTPCYIFIHLADNRVVYSAGVRSVVFQPKVESKVLHSVKFSWVLHVSDLRNNLLSVLYLVLHSQFHIHIYHHCMNFLRDKKLLFCAPIDPTHIAYLSGSMLSITHFANLSAVSGILPLYLSLWHHHLAHYHYQGVKSLIFKGLATGIKLDFLSSPDSICESCLSGKMHAHFFFTTHPVTSRLLGLIHSDLYGSLPVQTHSSYKY